MRKKLEKQALTQLKNRIAQSNRQAGGKNPQPAPETTDNNDSDVDPTEKPDHADH